MSDATLIIVLAAIPTTLAAMGGLVVSIIGTWRSGKALTVANQTHTLVNSGHQAIQQELKLAQQKISDMETLVATMLEAKRAADGKPLLLIEAKAVVPAQSSKISEVPRRETESR